MKGFIQRLALLIHWIGFIVVVIGPVAGLSVVYSEYDSYTTRDGYWSSFHPATYDDAYLAELFRERVVELLGITLVWVIIFPLFLWVLKWLISGNKSIFPWKS